MKKVRSTRSIPHAAYFPSPAAEPAPARWLAVVRNDARELAHFWPVVLSDSSISILANEGLIKKIYLPKLIFPIARVLINLTTFLLSLAALYLLAGAVLGARLSPAMVLLPVVIALFTAFAKGLGLVLAVANTFYRDIGHLITVILQAWYFATPIIWGDGGMTATMQARCWLNPVFPFIRAFQAIICDGRWPAPIFLLSAAIYATVSLGIGYVTFKCHENKLVFRL